MNEYKDLFRAYQTIKFLDNQEKQTHQFEFRPQLPDPSIPYEFKLFRIPKSDSRQKQKARDCQAKLLAFYELKKHVTTETETAMSISTTSKYLKQIFGNYRAVSRVIDVMIECGLIAEYDEKYSFDHYKTNYSKKYVFNKAAWKMFVAYCEEENILAYQYKKRKKVVDIDTLVDNFDLAFTASRVLISSKCAFYKPLDMSCQQFEDFIKECIRRNYKELIAEYQAKADRINETYYKDDPDRQIRYEPTITWNKKRTKVIKIGIRATNSTVSAKKTKEAGDPEHIIYREDLMKHYCTLIEFDVKSSIPRVTYLLNTGKWLPMSVDFYKLIWDEFCKMCPSFAEQEWNEENREMIKHFHMRGYFDTYDMIAAHTKRAISLKGNYKAEDWKSLDNTMKMFKKAVETALGGKLYDSEIFLHESNIYMTLAERILAQGYKLTQCYDGFFTDKPVENIEAMLEEIALSYHETYKQVKQNNKEEINKESRETIEEYNKIINKEEDNNNKEKETIIDTLVDNFATNTNMTVESLVEEAMNDENEPPGDKNEQNLPLHIIKQRQELAKEQMRWLENYKKWRETA